MSMGYLKTWGEINMRAERVSRGARQKPRLDNKLTALKVSGNQKPWCTQHPYRTPATAQKSQKSPPLPQWQPYRHKAPGQALPPPQQGTPSHHHRSRLALAGRLALALLCPACPRLKSPRTHDRRLTRPGNPPRWVTQRGRAQHGASDVWQYILFRGQISRYKSYVSVIQIPLDFSSWCTIVAILKND